MPDERQGFLDAQTVTCGHCSGAGELLELEKDGRTRWAAGNELARLLDDGWAFTDSALSPKECTRCNGFGKRNRAETGR